MSDAMWAATAAAAVGIAGNVTAVLVAWNASRQERDRRTEEREDAENDRRRDTYEKYAWQLARLHKYAVTGYPPSADDWRDWLDYYAYWSGAVRMLGRENVVARVDALTRYLDGAGEALAQGAITDQWRTAYEAHAAEIETARLDVERAMRDDLDGELAVASVLNRPPDGVPGRSIPDLAPSRSAEPARDGR